MSRAKTPSQQVTEAIDTPLNLEFEQVCDRLSISEPDLRDRLEARLNDPQVQRWLTIPVEHGPLIEAITRDLESEASVRRIAPQHEEAPQLPLQPPILEDEPQPKRRGGQLKKQSTNLTSKKAESLKKSDQKAQQLAKSDQQVKVALHARKGQKSGAQLATIELAAEDLTYRKIKGDALTRKVGQLTSEIASESDFDPIQVLAELGIDSNSTIFEELRQQVEPALGKLESATAEIVDNAWVNGVNLETEIGNLESLMSLSDSTSDYWQ
jgi:hypothetical protein